MTWVANNAQWIAHLVWLHLWLSVSAILVSVLIAVPVGWLVNRHKLTREALIALISVIYAVPSLPMFIVIPAITGVSIRSAMPGSGGFERAGVVSRVPSRHYPALEKSRSSRSWIIQPSTPPPGAHQPRLLAWPCTDRNQKTGKHHEKRCRGKQMLAPTIDSCFSYFTSVEPRH